MERVKRLDGRRSQVQSRVKFHWWSQRSEGVRWSEREEMEGKKRIPHAQPEGSRRVASLKKTPQQEKWPIVIPQSEGHRNGSEAALKEQLLRFYFERLIPLPLSSSHLHQSANWTVAPTRRPRPRVCPNVRLTAEISCPWLDRCPCGGGATGVTEVHVGPVRSSAREAEPALFTAGWIHKVQMVKITSESKTSAGSGQICEGDLIAVRSRTWSRSSLHIWISSSVDEPERR